MKINFYNLNRVLIIRLSSLGDILLTTPLVRSIKNQHKSIEIDFLLRKEYEDIYKYNPRISNIFLFENQNSNNIIKQLHTRKYDLIIDLQNNFRGRRVIRKLKRPSCRFHKRTLDKFLLVNFKINRMKELPQIPVRYSEVIHGFTLDEKGLEIFLPENIPFKINKDENYIGLCPGSKHFTKQYPADYFIELGNSLSREGFKIALFGGMDDKELCKRISKSISGSIDLSNNNLLLHTAVEMKYCKAVVCNDSSLLHLACAVNVPVIMLMGSTVKEFGFTPYKNKNLILENNSLSCRPCSHIGRKNCPKKHFKCMQELRPNYVLENIIKFVISL